MKKALATIALAGVALSAQADVVINQGFDNISTLASQGWMLNNASTPPGSTVGWFQGDANQFTAHDGAQVNSYIAADYNNAAPGGTLNTWLVTPSFDASNDVTVQFWLRAGQADGYSDQVQFGFLNGNGDLNSFTMVQTLTVPTDDWTQYTVKVAGNAVGTNARFAIDYVGAADNANYVGLDSLTVNVPEPTSVALLAAGLMGVRLTRRQRRK